MFTDRHTVKIRSLNRIVRSAGICRLCSNFMHVGTENLAQISGPRGYRIFDANEKTRTPCINSEQNLNVNEYKCIFKLRIIGILLEFESNFVSAVVLCRWLILKILAQCSH